MHGDKSQGQRERALARFEAGHVDTLVATDVAARGIDVTGISHVINFDPPADRDAYVHRIGRTGRAGQTGIGITFVALDERREMSALAGELGIEHRLSPGPRANTTHSRPAPRSGGRSANGRAAKAHSSNGRSSNGQASKVHSSAPSGRGRSRRSASR
jgi:superfamily II DNA/RNA helicase